MQNNLSVPHHSLFTDLFAADYETQNRLTFPKEQDKTSVDLMEGLRITMSFLIITVLISVVCTVYCLKEAPPGKTIFPGAQGSEWLILVPGTIR